MDIKQLSFNYPKHPAPLFKEFGLSFDKGHIYGLLGPNGAGKTTLLYLMSGLLTPSSGAVELNGTDVRRRLPSTMSEIFLVPDEFDLPKVTLRQYVATNSGFYPRFSMDNMERCLATFGMTADVNLGNLSLGQRKKIFMSFAMATHTRVLLMDEPTNGLDIPGKRLFRDFLTQGRSADRIIIVSTHQVKDIESVLDHIILIDRNEVIVNRSAEEIVRQQTVEGFTTDGRIDLEAYFEQVTAGKEAHHD